MTVPGVEPGCPHWCLFHMKGFYFKKTLGFSSYSSDKLISNANVTEAASGWPSVEQ